MASSITNWVDAATEQELSLAKEMGGIAIQSINQTPTYNNTSETQNRPDSSDRKDDSISLHSSSTTDTEDRDEELTLADRSLLQKIIRKGLIDTKADLDIKQKDPTSPLFSARSFEELNLRPELLKGIYAMGFNIPSRIQETALPILLKNPPTNLIAQSQSGTGKTAAFVLAMLSRANPNLHYPQILCLSPTLELAVQTGEVIQQMGKYCPEIKIIFAIRGTEVARDTQLSEHIIIGTPGKVTDWAFRHQVFDVSKIKVFVLDEADVMIATQGYQDQSIKIHRKLDRDCQHMLFSATYDADVMTFANKIVPDATIMRLRREEESLDNIKQYYILCRDKDQKYRAISNIYGFITIGQAMIFCHTRKSASWLSEKMSKDGHAVALLSGELTVEQRIAILNRFREGQEKVLITTNVMARGIDVEQVTLVVNYDPPLDATGQPDCETYLHRIGRTGRFGKAGIAINLIDGEKAMRTLRAIEGHFRKPIVKLDSENVAELENLEN